MDNEFNTATASPADPIADGKRMLAEAGQSLGHDAAQLASTAKAKAVDSLTETKQTATETITAFADAIRKAGDDLAEHDQTTVGRIVRQAADGLASASRTVSEKSPEDLLRTVRNFGRTNPVAFVAGAVLLGVALGRFARSSAHHSDHQAPDPMSDAGAAYGMDDMPRSDWTSPVSRSAAV
jgi:hypothetical protein